ncbi:60S ribosomal protein L10a [Leishmania donovani]|uniref:60S_ribosomal_protein_L10a_-_putative n=4 Tax=Leishmania donovani species complex TaxID=38574 RepID=A0A6L0XAA5_LEIIN|nr:putative 60S ribosomal protein L10a [Leishmania infantum JPCM5]XP_001469639.1 putative 60S ribosomal protein L10a [Leishmania infantum JPCM5]AYU77991.1 60S ribosomal protein L10a, putative [Leishmania donovani]CAC9480368.1 60S_ribosomal_protein_L10a_-_putative [Leishmania infantum]AYU83750.1 60S ribosomal protein L10a, putative [Leishmania donovani]TPP42064.1 Ribosomal protein L1p/L10e family protein [Leishmania donovani]TPP48500.1 Ribosomal protein L1p/L10e family protein [Leishmania dono|eukprot:XP_001464879.1 putative 60S ribosomal protein L10a [Leishmania infantum JPCM5]
MSKIAPQTLVEAIQAVLKVDKERKFKESVDLQVNLKNYDPQKDKRFSGSLKLPNVCRPRMTVCLLCDLVHEDIAKKEGVPTMNQEDLKKLNKNKKLVKKMCNQYDAFLCSESIIKTVPRLVGPHMHRMGKFPTVCSPSESLTDKIVELRSTVKFQLKKVLCLGTCVGHMEMSEEQLRQNVTMAINFLVSLLKKNWQNLKSAYIKSTMGKPQRIY